MPFSSPGVNIVSMAAAWDAAGGISLATASYLRWSTDLYLQRDAANTLAMYNGANGQTFNIYNTRTDGANYERLAINWASNVATIQSEAAGTGTTRNIKLAAGSADYIFQTGGQFILGASGQVGFSARSNMRSLVNGNIIIQNSAQTDFGLLQFGGTTSSFPALKRSTTVLQARLADDSSFAPLQGNLRSQANAVLETVVATHTQIITDAGGTAYRVLCVV